MNVTRVTAGAFVKERTEVLFGLLGVESLESRRRELPIHLTVQRAIAWLRGAMLLPRC